ncbi:MULTISPECIES: diacylglycerol kinase family protein [unclassified Streptomyces]|uniref:diacylglycerol kinase family protein n=1 Tax=unclassified Streptomyces TaxID=2593676 RepID=UPI002366D0CC|nr:MULTISPECIES: diacylglycerol kinase family protein [unclassified Streptomyces]MDF3148705.1 diacylglycerol kinase family protein [Streptomyces sp. T21Q-yed]WDF40073.1 diacylglycerol kinase family protein [Streptomyces sp. T12]
MAEVATFAMSDQLLVVIDPVALRTDGESVRIAKDVLSAGAATKVCLPEGPEEFARALARRGSRRPVVIGDDRALMQAVSLLHRQRQLAECVLSVVPVGAALSLAGSLGVPTGAVAAARAVLDGEERRLDLLVDDSDGVVLGALRIPPIRDPASEAGTNGMNGATGANGANGATAVGPFAGRPWLRTCQSLVRTLVPVRGTPAAESGPSRLRVEVDGTTLVDLDQPVEAVSVAPGIAGVAEVEVRPASVGAEATPLRAEGRTVTVSGAHFRYRADEVVSGPVRRKTWTVGEGGLRLVLPGR